MPPAAESGRMWTPSAVGSGEEGWLWKLSLCLVLPPLISQCSAGAGQSHV